VVAVRSHQLARARSHRPAGGRGRCDLGGGFILKGLTDSTAIDAVETVLQVLIVITLVLMVTVALFNRPRMPVSPALRDFPGALEEWRVGDSR
jgi:hypothetical protein